MTTTRVPQEKLLVLTEVRAKTQLKSGKIGRRKRARVLAQNQTLIFQKTSPSNLLTTMEASKRERKVGPSKHPSRVASKAVSY